MALSGTITGGWVNGARTRITWSGSQSISGNYTNVTARRYLDVGANNWYYTIGDAGSNWLSVNGSSGDTGKQNGTWHDGSYLIQTRTVRVNHNSDGKKSINISGRTYCYGGTQTSASATVTLDTIPRASDPTWSKSSYVIGETMTINMNRKSSSFTHNGTIQVPDNSSIKSFSGAGSSYSWTPNSSEIEALYARMPNTNSTSLGMDVTTYSGGTNIGTGWENATIRTDPAACSPIFEDFTFQDTNATTAALTGNNQIFIQGKSTLRSIISAANKMIAQLSASAVNYVTTVDGKTLTTSYSTSDLNVDVGTLNGAGTLALAVRAVDSRGNSATITKNITVVPYVAPIITSSAARLNGFEDTTTLKINGTFSKVTVGGSDKNAIVANGVKYRIAQDGGTPSAWINATFSQTAGAYTAPDIYLALDNGSTFVIEVQVTDRLGVSTRTINVGRGVPIMMISTSGDNVGVGKMPAAGRKLDVAGDIYASGKKLVAPAAWSTNVTGQVAKSLTGNYNHSPIAVSLSCPLEAGATYFVGFHSAYAKTASNTSELDLGLIIDGDEQGDRGASVSTGNVNGQRSGFMHYTPTTTKTVAFGLWGSCSGSATTATYYAPNIYVHRIG